MRRGLLFFVAGVAAAQTTVTVRDGDYTTTYRIAAGTVGAIGTSPTLQLKDYTGNLEHTLTNGTEVLVQGVWGCPEMAGYRLVVNANQTAGTLQLTDLGGNAVICSGTWRDNYEGGRLGVVHTYTLNSHPRVYVPPPSAPAGSGYANLQALNARVNGTTADAPIVSGTNTTWVGLTGRYTGAVNVINTSGTPVCDGITPAYCSNAANNAETGARSDFSTGFGLFNLGLMAYASQTSQGAGAAHQGYGGAAMYLLNYAEQIWSLGCAAGGSCGGGNFNAYLQWLPQGGRSSGADWVSLFMNGAAADYSLMRSQMTPPQRTAFANKMLDGIEANPTCTVSTPTYVGGLATVSGGVLTLPGGGLSVFQPGDWLLMTASQSYGATYSYGKVGSVQSDTQLVLASGGLGSGYVYRDPAIPTGTAMQYNSWSTSQCGFAAIANLHGYAPPYAAPTQIASLVQPISGNHNPGDSDTFYLNDDVADISLTPPFYLELIGNGTAAFAEYVQVNSISGNRLNVTRGALGTTVESENAGGLLIAVRWPSNQWTGGGGILPYAQMGQWTHNLTLQKQMGFIAMALALADDDPRAVMLLQDSINYYHDYTLFDLERTATIGMDGGNTIGYQMGRWGEQTAEIAAMLYSGLNYDITQTSFLRRYTYYATYIPFPGAYPMCNTAAGGGCPSGYSTNTAMGPGDHDWTDGGYQGFKNLIWADVAQWYQQSSNEAAYIRWLTDTQNGWTAYQYWQGLGGAAHGAYRLLFTSASDPQTDYTTLSPWMLANITDNPASPLGRNMLVSKSSFSAGSYLWANGTSYANDHDYSDGTYKDASDYFLAEGLTPLIAGEAANGYWNMLGGSGYNNAFVIGSTGNERVAGSAYNDAPNQPTTQAQGGPPEASFDEFSGSGDYVFARLNYANSWATAANVSHAYRYFDHIKWTPNHYVIVVDDVAVSGATSFQTAINYWTCKAVTSCGTSTGTVTGGGTAAPVLMQTYPSAAMVSTVLLFPDGQSPSFSASVQRTPVYRQVVNWSNASGAKMIAVHRLAPNNTDSMPAVGQASTDSTSMAAQVNDGDNSFVVVYPKDGTAQNSRSAVTTYSGNGQAVFHGLTAGTYSVLRDGATYLSHLVVGNAGVLSFTASGAHIWTVTNTPLLEVVPRSLAMGCDTGFPAAAQTVAVSSSGVVLDNWSETNTQSWLAVSPRGGNAAGNFIATVNCNGLGVGAYADTITVGSSTAGVTNSPLTVAVGLTVAPMPSISTASTLPSGEQAALYTQALSGAGGLAPYSWAIAGGGLPAGLSLSSAGLISGTPTVFGTSYFTASLTDANQGSVNQAFQIAIVPPMRLRGAISLAGGVAMR